LVFVKPGVGIDAHSGQALDRHLRFEEVVRGGEGCVLTAPLELDETGLDESGRDAARALLWAAATSAERLGGKRRRGLGRCTVALSDLTGRRGEFLRVLAAPAPPRPDRTLPMPAAAAPAAAATAAEDWTVVPLRLTLLTPVLVPRAVSGNVAEGLAYVPGTAVLAALHRLLRGLPGAPTRAEIARGNARATNAYPETAGRRGLPVPLCLFALKEDGGLDKGWGVFNRLRDDESVPPGGSQLKTHAAGFVGVLPADGLPTFISAAALQATTHGTIDDAVQRPTQRAGGVFTFQALRAGTVLRTELRLRPAVAERMGQALRAWPAAATEVRLGAAKKDDYGLARLERAEPGPAPAAAPAPAGEATVWLLSDLLLSDRFLRPVVTADALAEELSARLEIRLKVDRAFVRVSRTEGWNASWGLPQPSRIGLAAGSVIRFRTEGGTVPPERWERLVREGLGDRRAEGFGEVAVDDPITTSILGGRKAPKAEPSHAAPQPPPPQPIAPGRDGFDYARLLERAAGRSAIRRLSAALGGDEAFCTDRLHWVGGKPGNSQLGRLRGMLSELRSTDAAALTAWLGEVRRKRETR
jgi:CRISPR-associated protein Csx10